ncbi:hypothetical protein W97_00167 [Coniosporium apollinis CBS 100218]|uniref:Cryptic loci regulator 2 N-terminal domain-containing protein n=1 Tax=Coniosporium apollinis (strain CBS 100218) TaxID=1168221 RepID=R7YGC8_CONA1|nr:uncharacterized protein W97_00167 [Coniosporium apollinis CBS 100218]EON60957.1 hypothetical protein W97_00167 [Coniosporium apollinis CBS 100218]
MTRFFPLYVRRSDGKLEIAAKGKTEQNQPLPGQLDQTPDAKGISDYYREISVDEVKHLDWRRKLGGMLVRELGGQDDQEKACILAALPENYRLYEHIKSKGNASDGKTTKATKNHAGGGHDRQDAYLYGHPLGRKKRYRSPAEFFPHLLWLVTDKAGDPDNCTCTICSPEQLEEEKPAKDSKAAIKKEDIHTRPVGRISPIVEIPARPSSITRASPAPIARRPSTTPVTPASVSASKPPTPTPLPQPRSLDQQIDAQYNKFIFRPGELVWFNRGVAWGLGIILQRYYLSTSPLIRAYIVQPLSHPLSHPPTATITQEAELRPWLAWSAPQYTNKYLAERPTTYDMLDWPAYIEGRIGPGDAEVDGSIMAAKAIDASFTLFDLIKTTAPAPGVEERRWNGLFLGGEKAWVGEPVRLRIGSGSDVLVIIEIVEKVASQFAAGSSGSGAGGVAGGAGGARTSTISLIGDIYTFCSVPLSSSVPDDRHLPLRMREDLLFRNQVTALTHSKSYWKLAKSMAKLGIADLKGRWYESSLLLPILHPDYHERVRRGDIGDAGVWMNGRGDGLPQGSPGTRKPERRDAFGRAVPVGTRIVEGVEPPVQPPQEQQQQQQQQHQHQQGLGHSLAADSASRLP